MSWSSGFFTNKSLGKCTDYRDKQDELRASMRAEIRNSRCEGCNGSGVWVYLDEDTCMRRKCTCPECDGTGF